MTHDGDENKMYDNEKFNSDDGYYRKRDSSRINDRRRPSRRRYSSRHMYHSSNYRHKRHKHSRHKSYSSTPSYSRSLTHNTPEHSNSIGRTRSKSSKTDRESYSGSDSDRNHRRYSRSSSVNRRRYRNHNKYRHRDRYRDRDRRYSRRSHRPSRRRKYRRSYTLSYRTKYSHRDKYINRHRYSNRDKYTDRAKSPKDEIIHFKWDKGMNLSEYVVLNKVSDGTFGRVLLCEKAGKQFAVKVVRDVDKYTQSAKIEADILLDIKNSDVNSESHCVILHDNFMYRNRNMCLVFEKLGPSLYEFLEKNDFKGFFISDIQNMAYQLLKGLSFLKKKRLVHTDIKPENILLVCGKDDFIEVPFPRSHTGMMTKRPAMSDIKLIDFGSAIYEDEYHSSIINTRQYRAPEVILGNNLYLSFMLNEIRVTICVDIGWSYSSDLWSLGCTLMELYTGHLLFRTHSHMEHLAMMEKTIGKFPQEVISSAKNTQGKNYINRDEPRLDWPEGSKSKSSVHRVEECKTIMELVKPEHRLFGEFIRYILNLDSNKRPTPEEAMQHEFFTLKLPEN
ncbi:serine-threonine protein kinase, putative [Theileria annulata]|uniref:Serine-threonine protein kinase, putative n=1 Tax=Theileria annulata TaxID=5874 RepID=Q4UGA0_THEAN|nr:serine-threonine protein kinase, putative [Theileria annulata]CAI73889.1 serine-threonine protein kinase, putative [Theileria annulata]|eukprot:XP_954566.1 serine-threonine protein kinase, putative [Theileria annulata]